MSQYPSDFEDTFSEPVHDTKPKRGWLGRNWLWFVPLIILLPVFCCCGGGGALLWWGLDKMKTLPPYVDSVAAAQQDAAVQQALGTPIEVPTVLGVPNGGEFNYEIDNTTQRFDAEIPLVGSTVSGTLHIEAESADGVTWIYTVREVVVDDGSGTVIDLMPANSALPAPSNEGDTTDLEAEPE